MVNGFVPNQTPSLLQSMVASLPCNPMGFHSMQFPSYVSHCHLEQQQQRTTTLSHAPRTDNAALSSLFGHLPADAFEPVPIGVNTGSSVPPMDASFLESVLEFALGVVSEPDTLSNASCNVRKASEPPTTASPSMPKRRRVSTGDQEPRFRGYQEKQWEEQFEVLLKFKEANGHCLVPHTYRENQALSRWVKRQRYQYKLKAAGKVPSTMTDARIQKLEEVGFVWDSHATAWENRLRELKEYHQSNGDCNVPSNFPENPELATWIKCQRRQYKLFWAGNKASSMTVERMNALNELGFIWKVREDLPLPHPSFMMF